MHEGQRSREHEGLSPQLRSDRHFGNAEALEESAELDEVTCFQQAVRFVKDEQGGGGGRR